MKVSVGIIKNSRDQILISNRKNNTIFNDHWEFPGGKLKGEESSEEALGRELNEELGIVATQIQQIENVKYKYSDFTILLIPFLVIDYSGVIINKEGQALKWVSLGQLNQTKIMPASKPVIKYLEDNN